MNGSRSALPRIVYGIVRAQPNGLKHAEVVHEVRRRGIKSDGLSAEIHSILMELVTSGELVRNQNDRLERRYKPAAVKSRLRILVVDDDMDTANTSAAVLEDAGYDVRTVYSGEAALVVAEETLTEEFA